MWVVIDSTLSWESHIERTCSGISLNLLIINRPSKTLDLNELRMLYCGLICPLLSYGTAVWGHSARALTRRIFVLQKRAVRYTVGLKHLESCRNSFNLMIPTVYSLHTQETILYVRKKCKCTVNEQIHIYNTRNNKDYHKYGHNFELYNNRPSAVSCIFYNRLPSNIKQRENKNPFKREL
jgi:hypothetical protein